MSVAMWACRNGFLLWFQWEWDRVLKSRGVHSLPTPISLFSLSLCLPLPPSVYLVLSFSLCLSLASLSPWPFFIPCSAFLLASGKRIQKADLPLVVFLSYSNRQERERGKKTWVYISRKLASCLLALQAELVDKDCQRTSLTTRFSSNTFELWVWGWVWTKWRGEMKSQVNYNSPYLSSFSGSGVERQADKQVRWDLRTGVTYKSFSWQTQESHFRHLAL